MHIIVVDRDPVVLAMVRTFAGKQGHRVDTVDAIRNLPGQMAKATSPDIVLLDLSMLGASPESLEGLPLKNPLTSWILMATDGAVLPPGTALAYGEATFLRKPVRLTDLEQLLVGNTKREPNRDATSVSASTAAPSLGSPHATVASASAAAKSLQPLPHALEFLVVDDQTLIHKMYAQFISEHFPKSTMASAYNGHEALAVLEEHGDFDIILLDMRMPVMGGLEFLEALKTRRHPQRFPVILVTTEGQQEEVVRGLRAGAKGYLVKPFKGEVLRDMIEVMLGRAQHTPS